MRYVPVLLSADDRTGALEIGGLLAGANHHIPVGPHADDVRCCVVDIASRHVAPVEAQARMAALLRRNAGARAHKMDAGLRGNWAYEIDVLLDAGHKVAVVCAFPDADRRCRDGVVYIHGKPVLESVFGQDPLNAPVSSRPAEVLEHAGVRGDVVVWDADNNVEMYAAVRRALAEDRVLVGAAGALGALGEQLLGRTAPRQIELPAPLVVLCGSLNPLSRQQIDCLAIPPQGVEHTPELLGPLTLIATPMPPGDIDPREADAMAGRAAAAVTALWPHIGTLVVIGGDTVGAVVGDETLEVRGMFAPGIPVSRFHGVCLVTKGGGIGRPDTLTEMLARCS